MNVDLLNDVISFADCNFSDDNKSTVQLKNYKKLLDYVSKNGEVISSFDAEYLLDKCPKIKNMVDKISKLDLSILSNDENLISLITINNVNNMMSENSDELIYAHEYRNHDLDLTRLYLNEIKSKILTPEEEYELAKRKDKGDQEAFQQLVNSNLRLVVSIAKMYVKPNMPLMDLVQEGNLGLMKAVEKFDYTKGYKLSTYATWWIRQSISRSLADKSRNIRIPVHFFEMVNKINKATKSYEVTYGDKPTVEELADITGIPDNKVYECLMYADDTISLEAPIKNNEMDEDSLLGDFISDPSSGRDLNINEIIGDEFFKDFEGIPNLSDREKEVIKRRFGFYDRTYTLEEIGKLYHLTRERVRQIEDKALRKLRKSPTIKQYDINK